MKQTILFTVFLFFFSFSFKQNSNAAVCTSTGAGNWNAAGSWSCGAVPGCGDTIYINHTITVTSSEDYRECTLPMFIIIQASGTLHFNDGRRIRLPCNSGVTLDLGGKITTNSYNGNSEELEMGGGASGCGATTLWQSSHGQLNGPTVLGTGLPIELLSFDANYIQNKLVSITWKTASETNNDYFTIERSLDAVNFEPILISDGAGNSNLLIHYEEIDYSPINGISYYRLKQTDYDGNTSYSKKVSVSSSIFKSVLIFPNPTDENFSIQINGSEDEIFIITISDLIGKEILSESFAASSDSHIELIETINKLVAGTYMVTATSKSSFFSQKLIVK